MNGGDAAVDDRTRNARRLDGHGRKTRLPRLARELLCPSGMKKSFDRAGFPELLHAIGGFGLGALSRASFERAPSPGVLPPPRSVFVADDGRALAWLGQGRPCVVHPSLDELCLMHGIETEATLAA